VLAGGSAVDGAKDSASAESGGAPQHTGKHDGRGRRMADDAAIRPVSSSHVGPSLPRIDRFMKFRSHHVAIANSPSFTVPKIRHLGSEGATAKSSDGCGGLLYQKSVYTMPRRSISKRHRKPLRRNMYSDRRTPATTQCDFRHLGRQKRNAI